MIAIIKIVFLLSFLVLIHESGHYIVAKMCNIKVNEFAIGFGSKIWKHRGKETEYELRAIPLGGFVNLEGEEKESNDNRSYSKASIPKRMAVIVAGGLVNIIFGLTTYFLLILIRYMIVKNMSFVTAISYSAQSLGLLIQSMFDGIIQLFTGKVGVNDMMGPVGISEMVSQTSGIVEFIYLLSIISVSLGMTNLLPIIPLDGGKFLLLIIEAIRKKPLDKELELKIQSYGCLLLVLFTAIIAVNDIIRWIH